MISKLRYIFVVLFKTILNERFLIKSLIKRDISSRYKGSILGVLWSLINPLIMLAVYTFVFSVVFKARWAGGSGSKTEFALLLFSGLIIFNIFADCINRAPLLITSNPNFVKKVVFPIEILPIVTMGSALFQFLMGFIVWLLFYLVFFGFPTIKILLLPFTIFPLILFSLGLTWFIASLGVYIKDIAQMTGVITTVLLFLSPIFYSIKMLPDFFQKIMLLNPLTFIIESSRNVMIWDVGINWHDYLIQILISIIVFILGYMFFMRTKKGFSDVL
ncbi:ABC transporter permease [Photobacterium damselae]|uniref:ABC transporter permease n=1 Tax=Photobacterium damselae TaxID=38293 RepID=UPI0010FD24F5|nr:ABC transporter permease [Photobacterium damselae]TLS69849.1 ABC transporter permease [Photobacterium damselae subsp. damselae]